MSAAREVDGQGSRLSMVALKQNCMTIFTVILISHRLTLLTLKRVDPVPENDTEHKSSLEHADVETLRTSRTAVDCFFSY